MKKNKNIFRKILDNFDFMPVIDKLVFCILCIAYITSMIMFAYGYLKYSNWYLLIPLLMIIVYLNNDDELKTRLANIERKKRCKRKKDKDIPFIVLYELEDKLQNEFENEESELEEEYFDNDCYHFDLQLHYLTKFTSDDHLTFMTTFRRGQPCLNVGLGYYTVIFYFLNDCLTGKNYWSQAQYLILGNFDNPYIPKEHLEAIDYILNFMNERTKYYHSLKYDKEV